MLLDLRVPGQYVLKIEDEISWSTKIVELDLIYSQTWQVNNKKFACNNLSNKICI